MQRPVIHSRKRQRWLKSKWKSWERMGNSPALSEPTSRIQIHERAGRLRIQQTKWLHILEQFLGPAVIIIPSIAFQRAGALVQMVLWRSIKNNFAHRQAQEGPIPARGRRAQMSAQATATNPPPRTHSPLMGTAHVAMEKQQSDETCGGGKLAHLQHIFRWGEQQFKQQLQKSFFGGEFKRQDCWFVTSGHSPQKINTKTHFLAQLLISRWHVLRKQGVLRARNFSDRVVLGGKTFDVFWLDSSGGGGGGGGWGGIIKG